MESISAGAAGNQKPAAPVVSSGCVGCWAANYCAVYSLAGPQPPPACPLVPRRPAPKKSQPPQLYDTEF